MRAIDGIGLTELDMDSTEALPVMHVQATARVRVSNLQAQQADGMTETEWWMTTVPLLQQVMIGQFPVAGRVGKAAGEAVAPRSSDEHLYRFGLEMICDGVATMIARNQASPAG